MMKNKHTLRRSANIGLSAIALSLFALSAQAAIMGPNLVSNGDFSTTTTGSCTSAPSCQMNYNGFSAANWTSATYDANPTHHSYNFIFASGAADTTGATGNTGGVNLKFWGPNDGSNNGLPATSPSGGNFLAADSAYQTGAITQTISGLTVHGLYQVGFWWAAAQQTYNGQFTQATTENWTVDLGSSTAQTTTTYNLPGKGFSGWMYKTFDFYATSTTETLSFLAAGSPSGQPPFSLLDGVSLNQVPEPGTYALLGIGLLGLGLSVRRQRKGRRA